MTPGPWTVVRGFASAEVRGSDDSLVAESLSAEDAAVCAAAPELLKALEDVVRMLPLEWEPDLVIARAVLAKARGGT